MKNSLADTKQKKKTNPKLQSSRNLNRFGCQTQKNSKIEIKIEKGISNHSHLFLVHGDKQKRKEKNLNRKGALKP